MYNVSSDIIALFRKNYRQVAKLTITLANNTQLNLTEAHILQGGLSIDRYCVSGSKLEIGSAIASELTLKLDNRNGQFDSYNFEGATIKVEIGIKKWDALKWENATLTYISCGYFVVDNTPRNLTKIEITALDYMTNFDTIAEANDFEFPATIATLLQQCCVDCNVVLQTATSDTIYSYSVTNFPSSVTNLTYREMIQYIAEITGTCAYIDWDGKLRLEKYGLNSTIINLTTSDRFESDLQEQDITISGIKLSTLQGDEYVAGTSTYPIEIDSNLLVQHDYQSTANSIWTGLSGLVYRPFTATIKSMPFLYPLDKIIFVDKAGVNHTSYLTHVNFSLNINTKIESCGQSTTTNSSTKSKGVTKFEEMLVLKTKETLQNNIDSVEELSENFSASINASLGLNKTEINNVYYYYDGTTLADSTIIYTFGANGFAWTTDWNDAAPTWSYGITRDGNAILNLLKVYKLHADQIDAGAITADKIDSGAITADKIGAGEITADKLSITDLKAIGATIGGWNIENDYISKGNVKLYSGANTGDWSVASLVTNNGTSACRIMVGGTDPLDAKFMVLDDGSVYAQAVSIQGSITGSSITGSNISGSYISGGSLEIGYDSLYKVSIQDGITEICGPVYFSNGTDFPFPSYVVLFSFMYQNVKYYLCMKATAGSQGHLVTAWEPYVTRNINSLGNGQQLSYVFEVV